ncbi:MAG: DUF1684 domain-containing protein [Acidobacteria bacterium]|nr:DUF1684 domain-containing protein [Acidobacteriota bacterium]
MRRELRAIAAVMAMAVTPACSQPDDYPAQIAAQRAAKDAAFKSAPGDPVPADKMAAMVPLSYFPIDELYAVPATLEPAAERTRLQVPTSTGKIRDLERIGTLKFMVKGQKMSLTAFHELDQPQITRLFVPFSDFTNGAETYSAGRYMELDPTPTGIYVVDFNVAYHPFCYYNPEYDCPYPPKENRLTMPIRAGERLPKSSSSVP